MKYLLPFAIAASLAGTSVAAFALPQTDQLDGVVKHAIVIQRDMPQGPTILKADYYHHDYYWHHRHWHHRRWHHHHWEYW
jgi:hypothetical protein